MTLMILGQMKIKSHGCRGSSQQSAATPAVHTAPDADGKCVTFSCFLSFTLDLCEGRGQLNGLDRLVGLHRFLAGVWGDPLDHGGQQLVPFDDL